ncbi:MAG: acyltransferase family protein [Prosthecobacter sp.]|nr:acyltransferase family protein [Prosthecobacter sp.]
MPRNLSIDAARLFFAYGVVAIHLGPNLPTGEWLGQIFGLFCVPFFIILALYYFINKVRQRVAKPEPFLSHLQLDRLWVPYLCWTAIYWGLRLVKHRVQHLDLSHDPFAVIFYGGAAVHLYFLPLLLLCQSWVLTLFLIKAKRQLPLAAVLLTVACVFAYIGTDRDYVYFSHAFTNSWSYVGAALFLTWMQSSPYRRGNTWICGVIILAAIISVSCPDLPLTWVQISPLTGYAACSLVLSLPTFSLTSRWVKYLLGCSYGIYLIHHAWSEFIEFAMSRFSYDLAPYGLGEKILVALIVSGFSVLSIVIIRLNPHLRYWLLGENNSGQIQKETDALNTPP